MALDTTVGRHLPLKDAGLLLALFLCTFAVLRIVWKP